MKSHLQYIFLLGAALLLSTPEALSQKIKKDRVKVAYLQLPLNPISQDYKTYSATIKSEIPFAKWKFVSNGKQSTITQAQAEQKYLTLETLQRVESGGDIHLALHIGDLKMVTASIKKQKYSSTNLDTKKTSNKAHFYADVSYTVPATLTITDKNNAVLATETISEVGQPRTTRIGSDGSFGSPGQEYGSKKELEANLESGFYTQVLAEVLNKAYLKVAELAPRTVTRKYIFYSAEYKKYDYADLEQAQQYALSALSMINEKQELGQIREAYAKAISLWDKAIAEADLKNDKARINEKLYKMLHFNCALASMLTDDFQKAKQYAEVAKDYKAPVPLVRTQEDDDDYKEPILEQIRDREARQRANRS